MALPDGTPRTGRTDGKAGVASGSCEAQVNALPKHEGYHTGVGPAA